MLLFVVANISWADVGGGNGKVGDGESRGQRRGDAGWVNEWRLQGGKGGRRKLGEERSRGSSGEQEKVNTKVGSVGGVGWRWCGSCQVCPEGCSNIVVICETPARGVHLHRKINCESAPHTCMKKNGLQHV